MVSKRKSKSAKKEGHLKVSAAKLSNKRLNRLAKQGKLKRILGKKRLKTIVGNRLQPGTKPGLSDTNSGTQPEVDVDEIPLEEADYEYYARPGRELGFLSNVAQRNHKESRRKRKAGSDADNENDDLEGNYTSKKLTSRGNESSVEVKALLPIKCKTMGVIRRTVEVPKPDDIANGDRVEPDRTANEQRMEQDEETLSCIPAQPIFKNAAEAYIYRQARITEAKEKIATLCTAVVSSPEDGVGKLKELRSVLGDVDPNTSITVRKLAMLSLLEVFKDIIPEYRIRVSTDMEKHQKMKKETKKLISYEESLVSNYRHYLETLESIATGKPLKNKVHKKDKKMAPLPDPAAMMSLSLVAVRCLCELLASHPHFNFRSNIIAVIVPFMAKHNAQMSDMVCDYVRRIFTEDIAGDVTLEVVRLIGRLVKAKKFNVRSKVLATFLSLKVKEVAKPGDSEKEKSQKLTREERQKRFSKRERKRQKQMSNLERELQEAAVVDDTKKHMRLNTEIINTVFLTYFRILKTGKRSPLLSVVLEGLSKFAHLINVSFFDDIFAVMTDLVDGGHLEYRESLHCIQTAFTLLTGLGASLNIDPTRFYTHLYRTLFHLHAGQSNVDLPIALQCLDTLIGRRRRQVPPPRVLAFVKRLATVALQLNYNGSLAVLAVIRNIIAEHPKCDVLLETESFGSGEFMPELDEPDLCNAHNTALYELHLLRKSFHPSVRQYSEFLLRGKDVRCQLPTEMARSTPIELFKAYDPNSMEFKPKLQQSSKPIKTQISRSAPSASSKFYIDAVNVCTAASDQTVDKLDFSADLNNSLL